MPPKDVDRMANSIDPDQTAPQEQSDQNLHCLFRNICPNIYNFYGKSIYCMYNLELASVRFPCASYWTIQRFCK